MKFYSGFLLTISLMGFLSSCKEETGVNGSDDLIKSFKCVPIAFSRINDELNQWNKGDQVGMFKFPKNDVSAPAELSCNVMFAATNDGVNIPFDSEIGIPASVLAADFYAYYPYSDDGNDSNLQFNLADQSSGYAKYDLMWGQNKNITNISSEDMTFSFSHQFAKFDVYPLIRDGQTINEVLLKGGSNNVEFNIPTGTLVDKGSGDIKMYKVDNKNFKALLPPNPDANLTLVFKTSGVDGDKDYEYKLSDANIEAIVASKIYELEIELGDYIYGTVDEIEAGSSPYEDVEVEDGTGIKPVEFAAFPGALGHGRNTTGGRGGAVYHVTSLEDNPTNPQPGTFRWAVRQRGARTIVFDVSGTIHLKSSLGTTYDDLTIAGQTSPGGICIADYGFTINSDNVIIRFMRFRPGDVNQEEPDGLGSLDHKNIILDHCSVSWSVDECLSMGGCENITVQWCMAYQALRISIHSKGQHGFGGNWGGANASFHHNLLAHCESRMPRLGSRYTTQLREYVDIRNNVFYNWAGMGCYGGENQNVNLVNNYYKPGPTTYNMNNYVTYRIAQIGVRSYAYCHNSDGTPNDWFPSYHKWGKFFIEGNVMDGNDEVTNDNWTLGVYAQNSAKEDNDYLWNQDVMDSIRVKQPVIDAAGVPERSAYDSYAAVLKYVGASNYRDELDEVIISDVEKGEATCTAKDAPQGYINTPTDILSSFPQFGDDYCPPLPTDKEIDTTDTDGDGMPDYFERNYGLDPNNSNDGNAKTLDPGNNYTNLEIYLHLLVEDIVTAQYN